MGCVDNLWKQYFIITYKSIMKWKWKECLTSFLPSAVKSQSTSDRTLSPVTFKKHKGIPINILHSFIYQIHFEYKKQNDLTVQNWSFPSKSKPCRAQFPPIMARGDWISPSFPRTMALAPSVTYYIISMWRTFLSYLDKKHSYIIN